MESYCKKALEAAKELFVDASVYKDDELIFYYEICEMFYGKENLKNEKMLAFKIECWLDTLKEEKRKLLNDFIIFRREKDKAILQYCKQKGINKNHFLSAIGISKRSFLRYRTNQVRLSIETTKALHKASKLREAATKIEEKIRTVQNADLNEIEESEFRLFLANFNLSARAKKAIQKIGPGNLQDFLCIPDIIFLCVDGVGIKTLEEINEVRDFLRNNYIL